MAKRPEPCRISPAVTGRLRLRTIRGRRAPGLQVDIAPLWSREREADAITASWLSEIAARLGRSSTRRCGSLELQVPRGPCAPVSALDMAEAFRAIASPAVRRRILDLARQISDAD